MLPEVMEEHTHGRPRTSYHATEPLPGGPRRALRVPRQDAVQVRRGGQRRRGQAQARERGSRCLRSAASWRAKRSSRLTPQRRRKPGGRAFAERKWCPRRSRVEARQDPCAEGHPTSFGTRQIRRDRELVQDERHSKARVQIQCQVLDARRHRASASGLRRRRDLVFRHRPRASFRWRRAKEEAAAHLAERRGRSRRATATSVASAPNRRPVGVRSRGSW